MSEENPYLEGSAIAEKWEHRFERLKLPNGELHVWHCWCAACDMIKLHCPGEYKIVTVEEPSDPTILYPHEEVLYLSLDKER